MRIARSLHWQISRESRGEALLPDLLLGSPLAGDITALPCGPGVAGVISCIWNLTPQKNTLVWFQLHTWNVEVDDIL